MKFLGKTSLMIISKIHKIQDLTLSLKSMIFEKHQACWGSGGGGGDLTDAPSLYRGNYKMLMILA